MSSPTIPTNILQELRNLLDNVRRFGARYERERQKFQQSNAFWQVLSGKVLDYVEDEFELDRERLDTAERTFFTAWHQSPQFFALETEVTESIGQANRILSQVFRRAPSMREVHTAVRLTTRMSRLAAILAQSVDAAEAWVRSGKSLPVRRIRRSTLQAPAKRSPTRRIDSNAWWTYLPRTWWEWFVIVGAFVALVVALPELVGVTRVSAVVIGLSLAAALILIDVLFRSAGRRIGKKA